MPNIVIIIESKMESKQFTIRIFCCSFIDSKLVAIAFNSFSIVLVCCRSEAAKKLIDNVLYDQPFLKTLQQTNLDLQCYYILTCELCHTLSSLLFLSNIKIGT